ncbi:MAG: tetratricopeptide repeat protein, partial [bacterium]|nr:tetratricopeptide repeat protein [bacterium]
MTDRLRALVRWHERDVWQKTAFALMGLYAAVILATFRDYGITADEHHHVRYGSEIARWVGSFFQDRAVFASKNTWLYGGVFDLLCHWVSGVVPLDRYDVNHLCNAMVGWLGVLAAYRIGCLLGGSRAGFLSAICLVLTPRYFGHAFNNPKDIPFAVGYLWSVYYLLRISRAMPDLSRGLIVKTGVAIGLTLGVRIGGVLLWGYLGLCFAVGGLWFWRSEQGMRLVVPFLCIFVLSYLVMVLFWPWAQVHPFTGPWQAMETFSKFSEPHYSLFDGQHIQSTEIPRSYAFRWLGLTLPEFVFVGLIGWLVGQVSRRALALDQGLLLLCALFPIGYAVVSRMPLYDGIRHLLFVMPPLVVLAALGLDVLLSRIPTRQALGVVGILLGFAVYEMIRLHPFESVYFNRVFAGGVARAAERYDSDYWYNSFRQGLRWVESLRQDKKIRLGSFFGPMSLMANPDRVVCVTDPETADLYLGTTRFGQHRSVPGEIVHVVRAGDAPILYVIRPDSSYASDPFFADYPAMYFRRGDVDKLAKRMDVALLNYEKVLAFYRQGVTLGRPINQLYLRIGNSHHHLEHYEEAMEYYQKALALNPRDEAVYNNIGVLHMEQKNYRMARGWVQSALDIHPTYLDAWANMAEVLKVMKDPEGAIGAYREALKVEPESADLHGRLGRLCYQERRFELAIAHFRKAVQYEPTSSATHYNLGLALTGEKSYSEAAASFKKAVAIDGTLFDGYYRLGTVLMYQHL